MGDVVFVGVIEFVVYDFGAFRIGIGEVFYGRTVKGRNDLAILFERSFEAVVLQEGVGVGGGEIRGTAFMAGGVACCGED